MPLLCFLRPPLFFLYSLLHPLNMGNLLSTQKMPQLSALQILLSQRGLKVRTSDLDKFWDETIVLAPWINPENIWDPQIWMRVLLLARKKEVHDGHFPHPPLPFFLFS
uniref:Beta-retroviral matrix protein domain-containing protein n=1 Tax=Sciurus vulgaris TaxID=55149 RepID=A0A8D2DEN1_SCIVU